MRSATTSCELVSVSVQNRALVEPIDGQESHMIARTTSADALVHVPRGHGTIDAGSTVRYLAL